MYFRQETISISLPTLIPIPTLNPISVKANLLDKPHPPYPTPIPVFQKTKMNTSVLFHPEIDQSQVEEEVVQPEVGFKLL